MTIKALMQNNSKYYYSKYFGTHNPFILFLKNIISPKRFLLETLYGKRSLLPAALTKGEAPPAPSSQSRQLGETLKANGIAIVDGAAPELADFILSKYQDHFAKSAKPGEKPVTYFPQNLDQQEIDFMLGEKTLGALEQYFGKKLYLRCNGSLTVVNPNTPDIKSRTRLDQEHKFVSVWHYDTPNLVQFHMLLKDTDMSQTHMLYATKSHRKFNANISNKDAFFSDDYVEEHYELTHCVGKKGTIYLFDPNGLHRMWSGENSLRMTWEVMFTPGNAIIAKTNPETRITLENARILETLNPAQKSSLSLAL